MRNSIRRALLLVLTGALLGVVGNLISPKGIPFITPPKKVVKADEYLPMEKAKALWETGVAVFLDAREPDDYAAGHIGNALNLPALSFEKRFGEIAPLLTPETQIVVYCDGKECELSHRLADHLRELGQQNVHILFNGWTAWKQAGLPTEQKGGR
jgi:rhodanese-related sulfurtransferase